MKAKVTIIRHRFRKIKASETEKVDQVVLRSTKQKTLWKLLRKRMSYSSVSAISVDMKVSQLELELESTANAFNEFFWKLQNSNLCKHFEALFLKEKYSLEN